MNTILLITCDVTQCWSADGRNNPEQEIVMADGTDVERPKQCQRPTGADKQHQPKHTGEEEGLDDDRVDFGGEAGASE